MKWYQKLFNWLGNLFTPHNEAAIGKVAVDVTQTVAAAKDGNIPGAVAAALQIPVDASNIKVTTQPTTATASSPAPANTDTTKPN